MISCSTGSKAPIKGYMNASQAQFYPRGFPATPATSSPSTTDSASILMRPPSSSPVVPRLAPKSSAPVFITKGERNALMEFYPGAIRFLILTHVVASGV